MCRDFDTDGAGGETWTARVQPSGVVWFLNRKTRLYTLGATSEASIEIQSSGPIDDGTGPIDDGFDTLQGGATDGATEPPGVDPALIAEVKAHIADFTARNHAAVDPALVADVRAMAAQTHHGAAHVNRWRRVLMAFGEGSWPGLTPMTAAEAEENARRHSSPLWPRIAEVLAARESTSAVESAPPGGVSAQLLADVADRAGETHLGAEHVERWLRVLHTLEGVANDATIMLPAEARALVPLDPGRWRPVAEAIENLEARAFADALRD